MGTEQDMPAGRENRPQFTFYRSYYDAIRVLPKKDQAAVLLAICAYALDNEEPKLSGTASAIFMLIRPTLDAGRKKALNGKRGGESKQTESESEANDKQTPSKTQANEKQTESEKEVEKEDEIEKEVEVEVEVENECYSPTPLPVTPEKGKRATRFTPPTLSEVEVYCKERGSHIDPQRFVDFYTAKGWLVGKSKMKDWKAAVRTWEQREAEQQPAREQRPKEGKKPSYDLDEIEQRITYGINGNPKGELP